MHTVLYFTYVPVQAYQSRHFYKKYLQNNYGQGLKKIIALVHYSTVGFSYVQGATISTQYLL